MRDDFAVYILTHGRAGRVVTYNTLKKQNYTGKIYFIVDDEDEDAPEYKRLYGEENVIVFDKDKAYREMDTMDNFNIHGVILYARNIPWKIAPKQGIKYFLELDDDYTSIERRFIDDGKLRGKKINDIDRLFSDMVDFLEKSGALTVALCQGGDFVGGADGGNCKKGILRKAMNSFFCSTERPFEFKGTMNEDVNTYTSLGSKGELIMSVTDANITQKATQSNKGGMTEAYLDGGTYLKSFYSVICSPSCVKVAVMTSKHPRIHHKVNWDNCAPMILNEKWRKER